MKSLQNSKRTKVWVIASTLVQSTEKFCFIHPRKFPEIHTGIFGPMENTPQISFRPPSTRIRILLNPPLFHSGFKNFPVHAWRIQIEFACPHASDGIRIRPSFQGSSVIKCLQSMRHKKNYTCTLCRHFGLLFVQRLDTILQRHHIRKYPDSPVYTLSDSMRIYFFPLWRADLKIRRFAVQYAGYVWMWRSLFHADTCHFS